MKAFFTVGKEEIQSHYYVTAVDIVSDKFTVRIRSTGIAIWDVDKKDIIQEIDLDLTLPNKKEKNKSAEKNKEKS